MSLLVNLGHAAYLKVSEKEAARNTRLGSEKSNGIHSTFTKAAGLNLLDVAAVAAGVITLLGMLPLSRVTSYAVGGGLVGLGVLGLVHRSRECTHVYHTDKA